MRQAALTNPAGSGANATQVQGTAAGDSAAVGNPVLVGGVDSTGTVQELPITDDGSATGNQVVIVGGNDPSSGGVARKLGVRSGGVVITAVRGNSSDAFPDVNVGTLAETSTFFCSLLSALQIFNGTSWDRVRSAGATGVPAVGGAAASGSAIAGNPVLEGNRAATVFPTAVSDGQAVANMADKAGRQTAVLNTVRDLTGTAALSSASGTAVSFIPAGAAGVFNDIISIIITNETATATIVSLSDNGAGGNVYKFALAANGGIVINFPTPLPQGTAAAAWDVLNSAAVALDYVAVFAKNK